MERIFASIRRACLFGLLSLSVCWAQVDGPGGATGGNGEPVNLQFPLNSVNDILPIYERLTNKIVIKDSAVFDGPQVSLVTPSEVSEDEAIRLIEAALILNGYVIIHEPDNRTVKIQLARSTNQATSNYNEGEILYTSPETLPMGEALIGYFMQLENISPDNAATIMSNHVQLNPYGRITPVEAPPGLLITESAAIVRKFIRLQEVIDVPPDEARLMTDLVQLDHADANIVAQIIQSVMDARLEESLRISELGRTITGDQPVDRRPQQGNNNDNRQAQGQNNQRGGSNDGTTSVGSPSEPSAQLIADDRKNRILVQASPNDFAFILNLIEEFDLPLDSQVPLERSLNHIKVIDALPVIVDLLTDTGSGSTRLPNGQTLDTRQTPVSSSSLSALAGTDDDGDANRFSTVDAAEAAGGQPDRLEFPVDDNTPISVLVGKTRLIADRQSNTIIVMGSREAKQIVSDVVDRLDRRPPQVYLALVIGQLTLGDGIDIGVDYLQTFNAFDPNNDNSSGIASSNIVGRTDVVTNNNVGDVRDNLISNAFGPVGGLNVYGTIGNHFEVFINALETSDRFKVISRPVISVQNNKKASITSGQRIPTPGQTITDATGGATNAVLNTTIEYLDVVLKLEVIPLINADNEVTLEIVQINDTVVGTQVIANNEVPIIGTEELLTTVSVPDRHTIVLGGLITEQDQKTVDGIPFMNRLPVVGHAFKSTSRDLTRSELLIFIQPVVVNDVSQLNTASFDEDVRTRIGEDVVEQFPGPGVPTQEYEAANPPEEFDEAGELIPLTPEQEKAAKKKAKEDDRKGIFFWLKQK